MRGFEDRYDKMNLKMCRFDNLKMVNNMFIFKLSYFQIKSLYLFIFNFQLNNIGAFTGIFQRDSNPKFAFIGI